MYRPPHARCRLRGRHGAQTRSVRSARLRIESAVASRLEVGPRPVCAQRPRTATVITPRRRRSRRPDERRRVARLAGASTVLGCRLCVSRSQRSRSPYTDRSPHTDAAHDTAHRVSALFRIRCWCWPVACSALHVFRRVRSMKRPCGMHLARYTRRGRAPQIAADRSQSQQISADSADLRGAFPVPRAARIRDRARSEELPN